MEAPETFAARPAGFSFRRLWTLCVKEARQILRDPSSGLIAFALPMVLLVIFGYGLNLDSRGLRVGVLDEDSGQESRTFVSHLQGSPHFDVSVACDRAELDRWLEEGRIRGQVVVASDFATRLSAGGTAPIQVVTDGSEPNTAKFLAAAVDGAWNGWQESRARDRSQPVAAPLDVSVRHWYNPSVESRHFLVPGSVVIIMTVIGALLTSLVVAREWERGTMEALLSTPVTRAELILSKLLPYYLLGMASMAAIVSCATGFMGVPLRGSLLALSIVTTLFLLSVMGMGLLISTRMRAQFNSAEITLNVAFLPAVMLSGAFFEIASMPPAVRALTYVFPPRYFVDALQTIFLSGDVWPVLLPDIIYLGATSVLFLTLLVRSTVRRLDT